VFKTALKNLFERIPVNNGTHFEFDYTIKRSKRKTLCVQIKHGAIKVMAPMNFPNTQILEFLSEKQPWIIAKLKQQQNLSAQLDQAKNDSFIFSLGILKSLIIHEATRFNLKETQQQLEITVPSRVSTETRGIYIKKQLSVWYKQRAEEYLPKRLALISDKTALYPQKVQIKQYKARWGSCNTQGVINLNSLLMMTPEYVIDYVIVHELCHLKHMNHSPQFWALVEKFYPQFKLAKAWLKENKIQLHSFHR